MKNKGYTVVELVVTLAVFTVVYFTGAIIVSGNFKGVTSEDRYEQKIAAIEKQASIYGKSNEELFKESNSVYVTIEELALANVIVTNGVGTVADPRDEDKTLNDIKVKLTKEKDKVTAKVLG